MTIVSFISVSSPPVKFYFLTTKYFQISYFIWSSIVRQWVSSSYCRYHSLSPPRLNKIFGSCFLVFGRCWVTPHRLYRGSLTLRFLALNKMNQYAYINSAFILSDCADNSWSYLEPSRMSTMKLLAVNYFRRKAASQKLNWVRKTSDCADNELIVFRIQSNIYNEAFSR